MEEREEALTIRPATEADAERLLEIYAPYVKGTAITFEYEVPTLEEFRGRVRNIGALHPYLVAERGGRIVGYAYAGKFKERAAYQWTVETTIYLDMAERGGGIGPALYGELERQLWEQGVHSLCACITYTQVDDPYATNASMRFHERMGYKLVAHFHQNGYKFGRWYDMIWMEKLAQDRR